MIAWKDPWKMPSLALFLSLTLGAIFCCVDVAQTVSAPPPAAPPAIALEQVYRLQPGDEIEVRFIEHSEYNEHGQIRPDGRISLPEVGELLAAGSTVEEFTAKVKTAYSFLRNPDPTVQVRGFANRRIFVGGEVARPGMVALTGPKTVTEAIMESGGLRETAHRGSVVLIRRGSDGNPVTYAIQMYRSGKGPDATSTMLQPYDVVVVTESTIAKLDRVVDQYIRRMVPGLLTAGFTYLEGKNSFVPVQ
jgi:protein involved in polysaccharide export with SLBB domain